MNIPFLGMNIPFLGMNIPFLEHKFFKKDKF